MKTIKELYKVGYGPSSSHTIGPSRAAKIFLDNYPESKKIIVTFYGSLASTGKGHDTDKAVIKSLNGLEVEILECKSIVNFCSL